MDVHEPKLSSCWYFWPPSTIKVTLQKWQHEIVWPNYRTKWQENTIGPQGGYIPSEWKPRYSQFGVDRYTYWRKWCRGGEIEENLKVLVLLVLVWECNWLPTQTQQSTHALPLFVTSLGRIERESAHQSSISRTIVPHLILVPVPTLEIYLQIHKAPTK